MQLKELTLLFAAIYGVANGMAVAEPEDVGKTTPVTLDSITCLLFITDPVARDELTLTYEQKRAMQDEYEAMMPRGENILEERALTKCPKSNGCKCDPKYVPKQGQYCGYCAAVSKAGTGGSWEHIFECSKSGSCCDYGASKKCAGDQWYNYCPA